MKLALVMVGLVAALVVLDACGPVADTLQPTPVEQTPTILVNFPARAVTVTTALNLPERCFAAEITGDLSIGGRGMRAWALTEGAMVNGQPLPMWTGDPVGGDIPPHPEFGDIANFGPSGARVVICSPDPPQLQSTREGT